MRGRLTPEDLKTRLEAVEARGRLIGRRILERMKGEQGPAPHARERAAVSELAALVADAGAVSEKDRNKAGLNQDAFFVDKTRGAFGVFDGVGGNIQGEVASGIARQAVAEVLARLPERPSTLGEVQEAVKQALLSADRIIWAVNEPRFLHEKAALEQQYAPRPLTPQELHALQKQTCMATTAAVVKLWQEPGAEGKGRPSGARKAVIGWAGDSRVYLFRQGHLERLTTDDTLLTGLVSADLAKHIHDRRDTYKYDYRAMQETAVVLRSENPADRRLLAYLRQEREGSVPADPLAPGVRVPLPYSFFGRFSALTKTLSRGTVEPNVKTIALEAADQLLLTSDGVHDYLLTSEIEKVLTNPGNRSAESAAQAVVAFAKKGEAIPGVRAGQPQDDATTVLIHVR